MTGSTNDTAFMATHGAMLTQDVVGGKWYELFTSMFLHFGIDHLASNMIVLIAVGLPLENLLGSGRYAVIYLVSGLAGNVLSAAAELKTGDFAVSAGASGAVLGLMGAVIYCLIRHRGRVGGLSGGVPHTLYGLYQLRGEQCCPYRRPDLRVCSCCFVLPSKRGQESI